jgi:hypothetical protein
MKNLLRVLLLGLLVGLPAPSWSGSMTLMGAGKPAAAAVYAGPSDVIASPTYYWGLRCVSTSYTGNIADIYAPADASHTLLTCSSGGVINETLQSIATTCATSCTVKTIYEQVGTCAGTCNFTNATIANRPAYTPSCSVGKPCMTFVRANSQKLDATLTNTVSQPFTMSAVAVRTGSTGVENEIFGGPGAAAAFNAGANQAFIFAGGLTPVTASDNVIHAFQFMANGGTSNSQVDATANSVSQGATNVTSGSSHLGTNSSQLLDGSIFEVGIWPVAFSGAQNTSMCHNQFVYWTTGVSC